MHSKVLSAALFYAGAFVGAVNAQPAPIPVDIIGKLPALREPRIAPDGGHAAVTLNVDGSPLVVVQKVLTPDDREPGDVARLSSKSRHISRYNWANDERLVVVIRDTVAYLGDLRNIERMVAVGNDGSDAVGFRMEPNDFGLYRQFPEVINWLPSDPEHVLVTLDDEPNGWAEPRVHKVNVYTGKRTLAARNTMGVFRWVADNNGVVRVGVRHQLSRRSRTGVEVFYRDSEEADWEVLQKVDYFDNDRLIPVRFQPDDPDVLLVTGDNLEDQSDDGDADSLYAYDLTRREVTGSYRDEAKAAMLDLVRKSLPELTVELESMSRDKQVAFYRAYSDTHAPEYWLLDLRHKRLDFVASEYPELENYELSPMTRTSFRARDGLEIPLLLTLPVGYPKTGLPAVVMPHGGPWAHDEWGFNNYVQFFASRGYAVLQPQFRGSTGFGIDHEVAGYGEWGKAIQDDISDATRWLIATGVADPARICIYGESFGGYAAAMALALEPELYRCGISVNGVLDLKMFIDHGSRYLFKNINRKIWNSRSEAEDTSPYHLARQIEAPLLLIGSERDTVVPVKHSEKMRKRLKRLDKDVRYVELPDGEHWHTNEANELKKFAAVEAFLAEHLPPAAPD